MLTEKTQKTPKIYKCINCNFICSNKKDYNRHILTAKHQMLINANDKPPTKPKIFICNCGKEYKQAPSLTRHKNKCTYVDTVSNDIIDDPPTINEPTNEASTVLLLLKQNQEFKTLMVEQYEKIQELQQQLVDVVKNTKDSILQNWKKT